MRRFKLEVFRVELKVLTRFIRLLALCFSVAEALPVLLAQSPEGRLELADRVRMVQARDRDARPYFRLQLSVRDTQGKPLKISKPKNPLQVVQIEETGRSYRPFLVKFGAESTADEPPAARYALLVMDVSGSMLESAGGQTKFEASKAAARQFLRGFDSRVDHVAVVPFGSRDVESGVRSLRFEGREDLVQKQINDLPFPNPRNNTALYSATLFALEELEKIKQQDPLRQVALIVMTDGQNDVAPEKGDDPGLLEGPEALAQVRKKADSVGIQVLTIGFGDERIPKGQKGSIDLGSLRQLAWPPGRNFYTARDARDLNKIFQQAREQLIHQIQVAFFEDQLDDYRKLTGRELNFRVSLTLDDGRRLASDEIGFSPPQVTGPPSFDGLLSDEEAKALVPIPPPGVKVPFLSILLTRLAILLGLGGLLGLLWFGLPRLVWPERYLESTVRSVASGLRMPQRPGVPRPPFPRVPGIPNPPMPKVQRPQTPQRAAQAGEAAVSASDSKVTIKPARNAPKGPLAQPPGKRRDQDQTMVDSSGAAPPDEDAWDMGPPQPPGPKHRK